MRSQNKVLYLYCIDCDNEYQQRCEDDSRGNTCRECDEWICYNCQPLHSHGE